MINPWNLPRRAIDAREYKTIDLPFGAKCKWLTILLVAVLLCPNVGS